MESVRGRMAMWGKKRGSEIESTAEVVTNPAVLVVHESLLSDAGLVRGNVRTGISGRLAAPAGPGISIKHDHHSADRDKKEGDGDAKKNMEA